MLDSLSQHNIGTTQKLLQRTMNCDSSDCQSSNGFSVFPIWTLRAWHLRVGISIHKVSFYQYKVLFWISITTISGIDTRKMGTWTFFSVLQYFHLCCCCVQEHSDHSHNEHIYISLAYMRVHNNKKYHYQYRYHWSWPWYYLVSDWNQILGYHYWKVNSDYQLC